VTRRSGSAAALRPVPAPVAVAARIHAARRSDIPALAALVEASARAGHLLPRRAEEIAATLPDWIVATDDGEVVGCASLLSYGPGLSEVRSLTVAEPARGRGLGLALLTRLRQRARRRGVRTLFALTRSVSLFARAGYVIAERDLFPEKVWRDCRICPLIDHCDEIAVMLPLKGHKVA